MTFDCESGSKPGARQRLGLVGVLGIFWPTLRRCKRPLVDLADKRRWWPVAARRNAFDRRRKARHVEDAISLSTRALALIADRALLADEGQYFWFGCFPLSGFFMTFIQAKRRGKHILRASRD